MLPEMAEKITGCYGGSIMRSRKEVWNKIKEDWRHYRSTVLIIAGVLVIFSLFGKGVCPLANLWGLPCPGCGMTRSLVLLLTGRWRESWRMHPFLGAWILFIGAGAAERYLFQKNGKWKKVVLVLLLVGMIVWYVYRMATVFPDVEPYIYIEGNMMERVVPGYEKFVQRFLM